MNDISYDLERFIKTYQISIILEACLIRHSSRLLEDDVNWDKLLSKISTIYGIVIEKWQLFHPGKNKVEDILNRINEMIKCKGDYRKEYIFTVSEFNKLMLK